MLIKSSYAYVLAVNASMSNRCNVCAATFNSQSSLYRHTIAEHRQDGKHFQCSQCHRGFGRRFQLQQHIRDNHTKVCHCTMCPQLFKTSKLKTLHEKETHAKIMPWKQHELNLRCSFCQKCYGNLAYLAKHMLIFHDFDRLSKCI